MILRLSLVRSLKLKPRRTPVRLMLIDLKLLPPPRKRLRFLPLQVSPKPKVISPTLKLVERRRITKEAVVEEAEPVVTVDAVAEAANGETEVEMEVVAAEVVVLILGLALLLRLMLRVILLVITGLNVIENLEKKVPNTRDSTEEMAQVRLAVAEKISKKVTANLEKKKKRRSLRRKLPPKRKRRSPNLNMKKLLLVWISMITLEESKWLEVRNKPELSRRSMLLLNRTPIKKLVKPLFKPTSI